MPTPTISAPPARPNSSSTTSTMVSSTTAGDVERCGVSRRIRSRICPSSSTRPPATFVPPMSMPIASCVIPSVLPRRRSGRLRQNVARPRRPQSLVPPRRQCGPPPRSPPPGRPARSGTGRRQKHATMLRRRPRDRPARGSPRAVCHEESAALDIPGRSGTRAPYLSRTCTARPPRPATHRTRGDLRGAARTGARPPPGAPRHRAPATAERPRRPPCPPRVGAPHHSRQRLGAQQAQLTPSGRQPSTRDFRERRAVSTMAFSALRRSSPSIGIISSTVRR